MLHPGVAKSRIGVKEGDVDCSEAASDQRLHSAPGLGDRDLVKLHPRDLGGRVVVPLRRVADVEGDKLQRDREVDEVEVEVNDSDLRIDTYRASGAGGQHVNKTESAIRITHLPSGLVVTCQDEKSQHKNKAKAMKILRARLFEQMEAEAHAERAADRKSQVGSGDRSERIRTYNFPQNRLTDHRINLTLYKLDQIIQGSMDMVVDPLVQQHQADLMMQEAQ